MLIMLRDTIMSAIIPIMLLIARAKAGIKTLLLYVSMLFIMYPIKKKPFTRNGFKIKKPLRCLRKEENVNNHDHDNNYVKIFFHILNFILCL